MDNQFETFDVDEELRILGYTPPKAPNLPNVGSQVVEIFHIPEKGASETQPFFGVKEAQDAQNEDRNAKNEAEIPTVWLSQRLLAGPRLVGELTAEWVGHVDHPQSMTNADRGALSDRIDLLVGARRVLGVVVFIDAQDHFCWRLP